MSASEKVLVALSGGVDSAVAALLLKRAGLDVACAYMKNWVNEDAIIGDCPWEQDIADARAAAGHLGLEFSVVNLMDSYRERVVEYLLDGYSRGQTPNPDVMCNREIKFGLFRAWAKDHGFTSIATGHYARRVVPPGVQSPESRVQSQQATNAPCTKHHALLEGIDKNKDQSYFLALLSQEQLRDARFPVGDLTKPEVRRLAREAGLPNADKKDSQGICFIGEVKMADFLRAYVSDQPGPIVRASDERQLGEHRGLHYYTIGQRRGIGVPSNTNRENYVVVGKRAADRALLVAFDHPDAPGLYQSEVRVHSISWIGEQGSGKRQAARAQIEGRVRYRDPRVPIEFVPEGGGTALVRFETPQRALASGQVLAIHDGEQLLGGAIYV